MLGITLYVSCSQEFGSCRIQGVYTPLFKKGLWGETTYMNKSTRMCLYKIRPDMYVIGTRVGGRSFRAYLKSQDIHSNPWFVCHGRNKWTQDENMSVRELQDEKDESETISNKDAVVVKSRYSNINGGYRKTMSTLNGASVYHNDEDGLYLYRIGNSWVIGPTEGSGQFYMRSDLSNVKLPFLADWKRCGIMVMEFIGFDEDTTDESNELYVDDNFKAEPASIGLEEFKNVS